MLSNAIDYDKFVKHYTSDVHKLDLIRNTWMKSLIISVMNSKIERNRLTSAKEVFWKIMADFAWADPNEDDPILLYVRSIDLDLKEEYTRRVSVLDAIVKMFPHFVTARKQLVKALWDVISNEPEKDDKVIFVRNVVSEFLVHYSELLRGSEKEEFTAILDEISSAKSNT